MNAVSQASTPDIGEATTAAPPVVTSPIANGVPMVNLAPSPVSTSSTHTADGTHLDALVPMRSSKSTAPATSSAQPVDSTIRNQHAAMAANGTANGVSVGAVAQNGVVAGQPLVSGTTHSLAAAGDLLPFFAHVLMILGAVCERGTSCGERVSAKLSCIVCWISRACIFAQNHGGLEAFDFTSAVGLAM